MQRFGNPNVDFKVEQKRFLCANLICELSHVIAALHAALPGIVSFGRCSFQAMLNFTAFNYRRKLFRKRMISRESGMLSLVPWKSTPV